MSVGCASESPGRVLMIRPSALGDVARTVPCLVTLKQAWPDAQIDWLVRDTFVDVIKAHPAVGEVIAFPRKRFRRFGRSWSITREVFAYLSGLRDRRYDAVYDLQGLLRSGLLTWATRAPKRVGFADAREGASLSYNHRMKVPPIHTVDRMLGLLEADGLAITRDMRLYTPVDDQKWAADWLIERGLADQRYAIIAPTAMWRSKQWPADRFAAVIDRLGELNITAAVVVAAPDERDQIAALLNHRPADGVMLHDAVGQTRVGQLMALIERCELAICNDSAALHIAVGFGRRCVGLFGPTDPKLVGPYRYDVGVVQAVSERPIRYRASTTDQSLIASIPVDGVWSQLQRVMASAPPPIL